MPVLVPSAALAQTAPPPAAPAATPPPAAPAATPPPAVPAATPPFGPITPSAALAQTATSEGAPVQVPVAFSADEVHLDVRARALAVAGHVRVDEPPFYFMSDALELQRVPLGVELRGSGLLGFCHCLGSPLAVRFSGATAGPPHDAILRNPVLEVFGVPVAWAPIFWLRSPGRVGVLPPDVAWRGGDGLFLGEGVHMPWTQGDREHGVDLRAGGYVDGGAAVDVALRTPLSATRVRWDDLRGAQGLTLDAFGASAVGARRRPPPSADGSTPPSADGSTAPVPSSADGSTGPVPSSADAGAYASAAWEVHALRGERAVLATTDVDLAARRVDRASAEGSLRAGGWTFASGVRAAAARGGDALDLAAGGPYIAAGRTEAIAGAGAYDTTVEGGEVSGAGQGAAAYARGNAGVVVADRWGPFGASFAGRAFGDAVQTTTRSAWDGAAQARVALTLPFERAYGSGTPADPWVHRIAPRVEAAVTAAHEGDALAASPGPGTSIGGGQAWVAMVGWENALGRWGSREAMDVDLAGGAVGWGAPPLVALRARVSASQEYAAARVDFGRVVPATGGAPGAGGALVASARVGPSAGLHASARVAERDGIDPVVARALADPLLEADGAFLAAGGWTGGARLGIPLGSRITLRGGADVDLTAWRWVAESGSIEVHDPCGCVVVRATGAHRIGRPGVDVWLSVDVPLASR